MPHRDTAPAGAPSGSTSSPPTPTAAAPSTASSSAGTPEDGGRSSAATSTSPRTATQIAGGMRNDGQAAHARRAGRSTSKSDDAEATVAAASPTGGPA